MQALAPLSATSKLLAVLAMVARGDPLHILCMKTLSLAVALSALMPCAAWADPVETLVAQEMARSNTAGVAVAVVDRGRIARVQGFGKANIEHGVPVHADTLFKVAATGMQFTAAAVMLLVEDGKIELDAPVLRYLPKAPAKWGKVTIRQLLDHTSGLPATPNGDFRTDYTNAELLAIIAAEDLNFPAGAHWRFSYAGYIVLGFVIEEVTGEHWSSFMAHRIFTPLGMNGARKIDEMAIIPNRAAGYELRESGMRNAEWVSPTANSTADGSLYLSALDYAVWAQAVSERRLLSPQSWDILARQARLGDGATCAYVPGWSVSMRGTQKAWGQLGSWQGFQGYTLRYPDRDLAIVVYANGEKADVQRVARTIAGLTDPSLALPPATPRTDVDSTTLKARSFIEDLAKGRARATDFTKFAKLDFDELTALYGAILANLGELTEFALFDQSPSCGETTYRYRARYTKGVVDIQLGLTSAGKIVNLEISPLSEWTQPL
ncbi:hypothetical protein Sbs19_02240 [Sphingobium sp. BS19]|nr:hypothetical protein Sbs19_02240 [Sphingobium sp. BS19]